MAKKPIATKTLAQPAEAPDASRGTIVSNCLPGTVLSLGDGRALAFGESAVVSEDLALFLMERGQVA